MKHAHSGIRRPVSSLATLALVAGATAALATPAEATPATASSAAPAVDVENATLVWGLNGYSQIGIFGPWTYKDLAGNVTQLVGSVSGGSQTEYVVAPVPATSMPVSSPQKTPNAVKFTAGTGTSDPATGASTLEWDGTYTVNAYPAQFNAPNEVYSDPVLTTAADGSGTLTMNFALGEGVDMEGNPTPAEDFGRLTVATFDAGSSAAITGNADGFRLTPDYQGVTVTLPDGGTQVTTCTTDNGATGWWGSWPQEFISAIPSSVRPHFYSSGCGGNQYYKPALPMDVDLNLAPSVTVSDTTVLADGAHTVTVEGTAFDPSLATGTRPPLAGKATGAYVVFGKFASTWKPSASATSATRVGTSTKWAVPAESMATIGGANAGAIELRPDGSFTANLTVDKAAIDAAVATKDNAAALVNYGIYTYAGGGAVQPLYETYTPITFEEPAPEPEPTSEPTPTPAPTPTTTPTPTTAPTTGPTTGPVVKAEGIVKIGWATKPTAGERGSAEISVSEEATGKATVILRAEKGRKLKTRTVTIKDGVVTVRLPKLAKGKYALVVKVPGNDDVKKAKVTRTFRVT